MKYGKTIDQLRAEHRCFGTGAKPCAFFGFENDRELEDKIYSFIDVQGKDWFSVDESWNPIIDFFKSENINNVSFSGQIGIVFHKL